MATPSTTTYNKYKGNGETTEFSIGFPYLDKSYVKVYIKRDDEEQELLTTEDYSFVNDSTIKFPSTSSSQKVLADGDVITIQRETPLGSDYIFSNQKRLFPDDVMDADDLSFQQIQELSRDIDRCVKVTPTGNQTPEELLEDVYNKLDTADEIAQLAREDAAQAQASVNEAKTLLNETTQYVTDQKNEISTLTTESIATVTDARDTAINTIDSAVADAKSIIDTYVQSSEDMIDATVKDATDTLSSTIESAVEEVKAEGVKAAKDAIQDVTDAAESAKEDADRAEAAAAKLSSATETNEGIIRLATETEALEGFDNSTAITPLTASKIAYDNVGRVIQLSFNGTLTDDVITFTPTEGEAYDIRQGYEYEIDLLLEAVGDINNPSMVLLNGTKAITILNAIHTDSTALLNTDDMSQVMEYSTDVGYRWIFRAKYVELESGSKVFYMERPVVNIKSAPDVDGETVVINSDEQLQAVGVIDTGTTTARKFWSGTQKEYNEQIKVPDANTQYDITDDFTAAVYEAYSKSETNSLLDNKADKGLINLTNTAKESIVSWGMPDYTAGVSVAVGATVTATVDSVYIGYCSVSGSKSSITVKLYDENGEQITEAGNRYISSSGTTSWASASIPVPKGYAVKLETGENLKYSVLYPLKGVSNA